MSRIKVDNIRHNSASSDAITLDSNGKCAITATTVTGTSGNFDNLPTRNLIINGAMQVAQRGTSSTSSGFQTVDRFAHYGSGWDEAITQEQVDVASGTAPYTEGFRKAFRLRNGNQTSGAGAGDNLYISHKVEAQDMAQSGWNYLSSTSFITLSFWVRSDVAQNFYGYLKTADGTSQNYPFETGTLSANTWTKITKTIPGNSNLQFDTDTDANSVSMGIEFAIGLFFGTDFTGSITLNQWGNWTSTNRLPDYGTSNDDWYLTNDSTFEITGVKLELSDSASAFDFKSYAEDLIKCQRYYQIVVSGIDLGSQTSGSGVGISTTYPVKPRTTPTVAHQTTHSSNRIGTTSVPNPYAQDVGPDGFVGLGIQNSNGHPSWHASFTVSAEL